jgi:hypothetical protein
VTAVTSDKWQVTRNRWRGCFRVTCRQSLFTLSVCLFLGAIHCPGASPDEWFRRGVEAYNGGDFSAAAKAFSESAAQRPASGTLQNLGLAEWHRNRVGPAIQAWEQALWFDPFNDAVRQNLRFARKTAQLEAPEATWYEIASMWLPINWWAWISGLSLWFTVGMVTLPGILRWRKSGWQQALAAAGLVVFLFSLPAQIGAHTRSRIGFVIEKGTTLRLTPSEEAQTVTQLAPGEPARWERVRGKYRFIRTSHGAGWLEREQLGLICPR